jgi:GntR family transcriptional repressor for pyruvate dehydrogenase complex
VTPRFDPINRRTVAEEVRERLQRSIEAGELKPGEMLPSERTLCDDFGVARTSVREAIQGLASLGLIERRGNRAYVTEALPDFQVSIDGRKSRVREIFEVRRLIELPMAELVAERAQPAERAEIDRLSTQFRKTMPLAAFRALDRDFHWAVARACHNPVLAEVYLKVLEGLFEGEEFSSLLFAQANKTAVSRIIAEATDAHHAIARAIVRGDAVATVEAAERHLRQVEDRMIAQLV